MSWKIVEYEIYKKKIKIAKDRIRKVIKFDFLSIIIYQ